MNSLKTSFLDRNFIIRTCVPVMMFLLFSLLVNAQPATLAIGNVGVCKDATVLVPITGNNLYNIGAITLFINYNDTSLAFNSIQNIDPQLNGLIFNTLTNPSRVAIVWSKTSGATFLNTLLLNLKFDVLNQTSNLSFAKEICEVANISLPPQIIEVAYTDGSIFEATPVISSEPENKTIISQSDAVFQVGSPNASGFSWQESRNDGILWSDLTETNTYTGTFSNTLIIKHVPVYYNNYRYRCILNPTNCIAVSAPAILSVDSLAGSTGQHIPGTINLTNKPNPFSGKTSIEYAVPEFGYVTIKIFSMTGQIMEIPVEGPHAAGLYRVEDTFVYLPAGIYFCQYLFKGTARVYETYRKMIKLS